MKREHMEIFCTFAVQNIGEKANSCSKVLRLGLISVQVTASTWVEQYIYFLAFSARAMSSLRETHNIWLS